MPWFTLRPKRMSTAASRTPAILCGPMFKALTRLLEAARRKRTPRFLHVSTDEVYGSMEPGQVADEEARLQPNSPYAASKAASDLLARSYWQTYRFPAIVTRSSNNYGPYQFPEKLVPLMITNALEGKTLPIYGEGLNERDWIFVEDHCAALDRVLRAGRGRFTTSGRGSLSRTCRWSGTCCAFCISPRTRLNRPGHDRRYALETRKILCELDWRATIELHEGLLRTAEWYRANPEWVRKTKSGEYLTYYERFYANRQASLARI
jgi:dTDP-glucose 4,6-dehydratase